MPDTWCKRWSCTGQVEGVQRNLGDLAAERKCDPSNVDLIMFGQDPVESDKGRQSSGLTVLSCVFSNVEHNTFVE